MTQVVARIVVIVIKALLLEPIAIHTNAAPKKKAALSAKSRGRNGTP